MNLPQTDAEKQVAIKVVDLAISQIQRSSATQPREELNRSVVETYAEDMARGDEFPPVVVFQSGNDYHLADGYHRVAAAIRNQERKIKAEVSKGSQRDAILFSVGANANHGYRRSNEDKHAAVIRLLKDPEWAKWSDREIARRLSGVWVLSLLPLYSRNP